MIRLPVSEPCRWCRNYPCRCDLRQTATCACGMALTLLTNGRLRPDDMVAATVQAHQRTPRHAAWRIEMGL